MLVSHEVPICLLEESRQFNDYDYALVHLFEDLPEYFDFYKQSLLLDRKVILDNSIFELGEAFDPDIFASYIEKLKPTEYIVPDSLENTEETIKNFDSFVSLYKDLPGNIIGVVQGKTFKELVECYSYMKDRADKIAISFDYSYYLSIAENYMEGRIRFFKKLLQYNIIDINKPHHLLGCYLPQEFKNYTNFKWIESIDTSNPIVHGIKGIKYTERGLNFKEKIKLAELINIKKEELNFDLINYNIKIFRSFCN